MERIVAERCSGSHGSDTVEFQLWTKKKEGRRKKEEGRRTLEEKGK
jgi:hypothetical protein